MKDLVQKQCVHVKNWPLYFQNTNTLYMFPNFKSLFLRINFSPICFDILSEIAMSRTQCRISNIFASKLSWKNSHLGNSRKSTLIFWDNRSLSMCWVTYSLSLLRMSELKETEARVHYKPLKFKRPNCIPLKFPWCPQNMCIK